MISRISFLWSSAGARHRLAFALVLAALLPLAARTWGEEDRVESPFFWVPGGDAGVDELPLKASDARVEIVGPMALVELTQTYANVGSRPLEAVYVFPGSTKSAVQGLEMRIDDRVTVARIMRKQDATRTYETAKREGKSASLLEQSRPNVFRMKLANIQPGDVIEVTLRYSEWLTPEKGIYSFVFPTVTGPRYGGNGPFGAAEGTTARPAFWSDAASGSIEYAIDVSVSAGVPIRSIGSPTHEVEIEQTKSDQAVVHLAEDAMDAGNRDFVLTYDIGGAAPASGLLLSESNGEKYFVAMVQPPAPGAPRPRIRREYFFVVDVSGSMHGFPLNTAKQVMLELVSTLEADDSFNVLLFAGGSAVLSDAPLPATDANLAKAVRFLDRQDGGGGTELLPALQRVYETPRDTGASRSIVVLTDGYIEVEKEAFELVRSRLDEANVFAIGIGGAVNRYLIEGLAAVGQGEPMFVLDPRDAKPVADRFAEYASAPLLTDLSVRFDGFEAYDFEPPVLPDLLAERPITIFGKWRGAAQGTIEISGWSGNAEYTNSIAVADSADLAGSRVLEYVWARERIKRLSDYGQIWPSDENVEEVTRLGLKHSLLTAYTSFVAVDERIRGNPNDATSVNQRVPLPSGVENEGIQTGDMFAVPVTPEPEIWALLACVAVAMTWVAIRRVW